MSEPPVPAPVSWDELQRSFETTKAVRKVLGAILAIAPEDAPLPGVLTTDGIKINALPVEYKPIGLITPDGLNWERETSTATVDALGHFSPVREDIESGSRKLSFTALEVMNRHLVEISEGIDLSTATLDATSGEVSFELPEMPGQRFYRLLAIAFDGTLDRPVFEGKFWPRCSVTSFPSEGWKKSDARQAEIGLTAYLDDELGSIEKRTFAGLGFKDHAARIGW